MTDHNTDREPSLPPWLEYIEHTADAGIRVRAGSREELFERAAAGMFTLITDSGDPTPVETIGVSVEAPDVDALMVRWLSELNFLHQAREMLFCTYTIQEMTDRRLSAAVGARPVDPGSDEIYREIKAVTYHGLAVGESGGIWTAAIIFDV